MNITQDPGDGRYVIRRHDPGKVQINETVYTASVLVTPTVLNADWGVGDIDALGPDHLEGIAGLGPEVVIVGTGPTLCFPRPEIRAWLPLRGIGVEFMDTAAACRTFNILVSEGRNVVCALIV